MAGSPRGGGRLPAAVCQSVLAALTGPVIGRPSAPRRVRRGLATGRLGDTESRASVSAELAVWLIWFMALPGWDVFATADQACPDNCLRERVT